MDLDPLMKGNIEKRIEIQSSFNQPYTQKDFNSAYDYVNIKKPGFCKNLQKHTHCNASSLLCHLLPILKWLPLYNWKQDILSDIISGLTVAIMHIPQGMAYSSLGGVPPIVGIYMAFFPVLIYVIFGTSRHVSMGTFAVVCMMASKPVLLYSSTLESHDLNSTSSHTHDTSPDAMYTPIQVATTICLVVGIWQVVLGVFRLGSLSVLMSETLVSGFTTGAAVLVLTSQMKHIFGIKLPRHIGPLKVIYTFIDLYSMINQTNLVSFGISLSVIVVLFSFNELIKPRLKCKSNFPIPTEMIMVIIGVVVSRYFLLNERFKVSVVGEIPTGLPAPALPPLALIPNVLVDGLVIAIVAFSINISMASIFATKDNYKVDANQELLASGFGNLFGSFFSCLPFTASLSRSLIQHAVGGKTQLASVVSCSILVLILLYIGPFFEPLPHCVLAGIILTALKGMLKQVKDLPTAWRLCRRDGCIWMITFLSVVLLDIDVGLGVGIVVSLASIILVSQNPYIHLLGKLPDTDVYIEMDRYHKAVPIPNAVIVRICGGLHFANKNHVQSKIDKLLKKLNQEPVKHKVTMLLVDMSAVTFVDPASTKALLTLENDLRSRKVSLCLAKCSVHLYEQLKKCEFFDKFPESQLYPSLQDAVSFAMLDTSLLPEVNSNVTS